MNKTIELNEQQTMFLKSLIEEEVLDTYSDYSETSKVVALQIINKLNNNG